MIGAWFFLNRADGNCVFSVKLAEKILDFIVHMCYTIKRYMYLQESYMEWIQISINFSGMEIVFK